jgi:signal transduction histidine kinase
MIFALKESQYKLSKSKADLEKITKDQKRAISDKTRDLARAQEATLNILEDLVEAKNNLEKYSKDLERAMQIKTDFTATVSHELRTPLAAIKEGIAIVADGTAGGVNDRQKEFLNIAKRNVDRLTRLINDVLDFQKLEAGRMEMDMKYNDINEVITDVGDTMSTIAQGKGLEFELDLEDGLPMARFDKDKIIQTISNIVSNALRYTDKGGIKISTEKKGDSIRIAISDTGIGIKESDKQKLFKRFSQLEPISERRVGGTGLGLAISKDIVDAHNGNIDVVSKPGEGSTFTITLPINGG